MSDQKQTLGLKLDLLKVGFKIIPTSKGDMVMLPADRFYQGKNGLYLDLIAWVNRDKDQYDQNGAIALSRPKDSKDPITYVGNVKILKGAPVSTPTADFTVEEDFDPFA